MKMTVVVIGEYGLGQALFGLGLSYGKTSGMTFSEFITNPDRTRSVKQTAARLFWKQGGHNKWTESVFLYLDVNAPLYWWSEADTYRLSTKQSESTMHTLVRDVKALRDGNRRDSGEALEHYAEDHFCFGCEAERQSVMSALMSLQYCSGDDIVTMKRMLPQSYMQRRVWVMSYRTFQNILLQRADHRLPEWHIFLDAVKEQCGLGEWLGKEER